MPTLRSPDGVVVLVVDDDGSSRDILRELLERAGAVVLAAASRAAALEILDARDPHVLLSNVALPSTSGIALTREIRSREKARQSGRLFVRSLPAAAITGLISAADRIACLQAGCHPPFPSRSILSSSSWSLPCSRPVPGSQAAARQARIRGDPQECLATRTGFLIWHGIDCDRRQRPLRSPRASRTGLPRCRTVTMRQRRVPARRKPPTTGRAEGPGKF